MTEAITYVQVVMDRLADRLPGLDVTLLRLYALLVLVKGAGTTLEDIHDAWSLWCLEVRPDHPALAPFRTLPAEIRELDRPYMEAVHAVAAGDPPVSQFNCPDCGSPLVDRSGVILWCPQCQLAFPQKDFIEKEDPPVSETPQGLTPPAVVLACLPRQWRAEAEATDPGNFDAVEAGVKHRRFAAAQTLRDCAQELEEILSISPRGCWEHPGVPGYRHPDCGFCWHGKDGLDVPVEGRGANREPRCPRCALAEAEEKLAAILADLVVVLGEAEGFIGGKDNAAFTRLAEAAGVA